MKHCVLLLLLALGCSHGAPVEQDTRVPGSCTDEAMLGVAKEALTKVNLNRKDGYIFSLHSLANVHTVTHGETGVVYYMTLNVVETNCSVFSRKDWKQCEARPVEAVPVYGQCKVALYINKVHRVVRLYKYDCVVRPAAAEKVAEVCPDCPTHINKDNEQIMKIVSQSLEGFNQQSGLANHFALIEVTRATSSLGTATFYNAEYTIQETTCAKGTDPATKCPLMDCEFSHKGLCRAQYSRSPAGEEHISVKCELYEPEAAQREKAQHMLGGETDHSHNDTHSYDHSHDQAHAADQTHTHDHIHDHTKTHAEHDKTLVHEEGSDHHHTHDHEAGSAHRHAHAHSHDHGHGHDHVHAHHAKAHNHTHDSPNHHHDYKHAEGVHTHEHDHELALDHDHKHAHLHEHEHHHHHHDHDHETSEHDHPEGSVRVIAAMGQPVTLPAFPDVPAGGPEVGVTLPAKPDPQIPEIMEPVILPFPTTVSADCPPVSGTGFVEKLFAEDPTFTPTA